MAGVKGRSGGARPGAGAPPKPVVYLDLDGGEDALDFLAKVRADKTAPAELRVRAAIVEAQYTHVRSKDGGKNLARSKAAKEAASGRFAPGAPPLRVVDKGT